MSWLRVDDGFTSNAKIIQLTDREFRVWMRLLCHCGKTRDPSVDRVALNEVAGLSRQMVKRFVSLDLLDPMGEAFEVHDWPQYQPKDATSAERQAKWRARKQAAGEAIPRHGKWEKTRQAVLARDAGVCIDCGEFDENWNADHEPHRDDLEAQGIDIHDLAYIVTRCHSCHAKKTRTEAQERNGNKTVTEPPPETVTPQPEESVTSLARAREPVPVPPSSSIGAVDVDEQRLVSNLVDQSLKVVV